MAKRPTIAGLQKELKASEARENQLRVDLALARTEAGKVSGLQSDVRRLENTRERLEAKLEAVGGLLTMALKRTDAIDSDDSVRDFI